MEYIRNIFLCCTQVPHVQEGFLGLEHLDETFEDSLRRKAVPVQTLSPQVLTVGKSQPPHEDTRPKRQIKTTLKDTSNNSRLFNPILRLGWCVHFDKNVL